MRERAQSGRLGEGAVRNEGAVRVEGAVRNEGAVSEVREESFVGKAAVSEGAAREAKDLTQIGERDSSSTAGLSKESGYDNERDKSNDRLGSVIDLQDMLEAYNHDEGDESESEYCTAVSSADEEGGSEQSQDAEEKSTRYGSCWVGEKRYAETKRQCKCRDGRCSSACWEDQREEPDEIGDNIQEMDVNGVNGGSELPTNEAHQEKRKLKNELVKLVTERVIPVMTSRCV